MRESNPHSLVTITGFEPDKHAYATVRGTYETCEPASLKTTDFTAHMAEGFEPATSPVRGEHSRPSELHPDERARRATIPLPPRWQRGALPA